MPPTTTPVEKMLESMMMQMLNPNGNNATVCCNCLKVKKNESQQKTNISTRRKKNRRKQRKSCLETIICLSKMTRDSGECQGCSCEPCSGNFIEDVDERYCSKCGQLLPGMVLEDQPFNQPEQQCLQELQRCQQECRDIGVQASTGLNEPLSVRIKVCPCPTTQDEKLYHSVSLPELSSTNPRLVDGGSSGNLVSARGPRNLDESSQSHRPTGQNEENTPEWRADKASIKKLALWMAKARLVEEAACWERQYARAYLEKEQNRETDHQVIEEPSDNDQGKNVNTDGGHRLNRRSFVSFEENQGPSVPGTTEFKLPSGTSTSPKHHHINYGMDLCDPGADFGQLLRQGMPATCCTANNAYCYNAENGPIPFGDHCEHACTCGNIAPVTSQFPGAYSEYRHQNIPQKHAFGWQQDGYRPDSYMPYGHLGNCYACQ